MISKKFQSEGGIFYPRGFLRNRESESNPSGFRTSSERIPSDIPLGFSGKLSDVRKTSHNKKPSPFETRSYDNQYKPK